MKRLFAISSFILDGIRMKNKSQPIPSINNGRADQSDWFE
jgi:hypothetical protein